MKRKLSSTGTEPSSPDGFGGQDGVYDLMQSSSGCALRQVSGSSETAGGFELDPGLGSMLVMEPGVALMRGMFYNTLQVRTVLELVGQVLAINEDLLREVGEGTGGGLCDLIESNQLLLGALIGSIEPLEEATEGVGLQEEEQSSSVTGLSGEVGGFILEPHLAQMIGMEPGVELVRGMFHNTAQVGAVLELISQVLSINEDLIGEAGDGASGGSYDNSLVESNNMLLEALMGSIESPVEGVAEEAEEPKGVFNAIKNTENPLG